MTLTFDLEDPYSAMPTHVVNISGKFRVRTDPGKVWKVLEFNVEIFKAFKSLENDHRYGKVWKNP